MSKRKSNSSKKFGSKSKSFQKSKKVGSNEVQKQELNEYPLLGQESDKRKKEFNEFVNNPVFIEEIENRDLVLINVSDNIVLLTKKEAERTSKRADKTNILQSVDFTDMNSLFTDKEAKKGRQRLYDKQLDDTKTKLLLDSEFKKGKKRAEELIQKVQKTEKESKKVDEPYQSVFVTSPIEQKEAYQKSVDLRKELNLDEFEDLELQDLKKSQDLLAFRSFDLGGVINTSTGIEKQTPEYILMKNEQKELQKAIDEYGDLIKEKKERKKQILNEKYPSPLIITDIDKQFEVYPSFNLEGTISDYDSLNLTTPEIRDLELRGYKVVVYDDKNNEIKYNSPEAKKLGILVSSADSMLKVPTNGLNWNEIEKENNLLLMKMNKKKPKLKELKELEIEK